MDWISEIADPERRLALAYAPRDRRAALAALWVLDERLGAIVAATREPMLGEIRLAWWREGLEALNLGAPAGEPLLERLAGMVRDHRMDPAELARLAEGWSALLGPLPLPPEALAAHADGRGAVLFALSADLLGDRHDDLREAGAAWALTDLAARISDRATADAARVLAAERISRLDRRRWPTRLRPLAILSALARHDCRAGLPRAQGSPYRVALALWSAISRR